MNLAALLNALPGAVAQGLIWGIMSIGVYITYKVLDLADLTVDGSMATGGAVCVMLMLNGWNVWLALLCAMIAGMLAGLLTGIFHTAMGIPAILAGILTQLSLYSLNLAVMDFKANQGINVTKYQLIVSQRNVRTLEFGNPIVITLIILALLIGVLYWFFGTETGCSLRATGANEAMSRARNFALKLLAVAIGAILYFIVIQIVLWLGLNTNLLKLLSALIVAVFLAIPYWKANHSAKHPHKGGQAHA